jgi:molybdate/tungstate transport system substrate-binding protein
VRPKETDLLALLEAHAIDYLFIYRSVAQQHKLKYITLPPEISLKNKANNSYYRQASIKITGKKPGEFISKKGAAMVYGITIPQNAKSPANPKGAVAFVNFILSEEGKKIMKQNGQGVISPPVITGNATILKEK